MVESGNRGRAIEGEILQPGLSVEEVSRIKGKPWTWVVRRIAPFKNQLNIPTDNFEVRKLMVPGKVCSQIDLVAETETPAGDWMTVWGMADELGVEGKWVTRRILQIQSVGEYRLAPCGSQLHLPPEALKELAEIRQQAMGQFDREVYFNLSQLAQITGRHRLWVINRLDGMPVEPILGLDNAGRAVEFYPKIVLDQLRAEVDRYQESGDMLTIPVLSKMLHRDRQWVERQLEEMEVTGVYRHFGRSGRVDLCYEPKVIMELKERNRAYIKPPNGWSTVNALVELTGKSLHWVQKRLKILKTEPKVFKAPNGQLQRHYPPEVGEALVNMNRGWRVAQAMVDKEPKAKEGSADKFLRVFEHAGPAMTDVGFMKLRVSKEELREWTKIGLVTRWKSGQYSFTKKAKEVAERIRRAKAEEARLRRIMEELPLLTESERRRGRF